MIHAMRRGSLAAVALAPLLAAPSSAFPCGTGDGGSSGSSGGSSGGSGGGSSSSASDPCLGDSPVVGRSTCRTFGSWQLAGGVPRLEVGMGISIHRFSLGGTSFQGTADHDPSISYRAAGGELSGGDAAVGYSTDVRALVGGAHVYGGLEGQVGGFDLDGEVFHNGPQTVTPERTLYMAGGGVIGAHASFGRFRARAEVFAGVRYLSVSGESRQLACVTDTTMRAFAGLVEPRVAIEAWVTPWAALGVAAGASDLSRGCDFQDIVDAVAVTAVRAQGGLLV